MSIIIIISRDPSVSAPEFGSSMANKRNKLTRKKNASDMHEKDGRVFLRHVDHNLSLPLALVGSDGLLYKDNESKTTEFWCNCI